MVETKPQYSHQNIKAAGFHLKSFESFWQNLLYSLYWVLYVLIYIQFLSNKHILFPWTEKTFNPMIADSESWHLEISSWWQMGWLVYSEPWVHICPIQYSEGLGSCILSSKSSTLLSGCHYFSSFSGQLKLVLQL